MAAIKPISDADNEYRMINKFTQGLHDKFVRSYVKRYVLSHSEQVGYASWHVLDAAKYYAKDHGVEENCYKAYSESISLLTKRPDSGSKFKFLMLTPQKRNDRVNQKCMSTKYKS